VDSKQLFIASFCRRLAFHLGVGLEPPLREVLEQWNWLSAILQEALIAKRKSCFDFASDSIRGLTRTDTAILRLP